MFRTVAYKARAELESKITYKSVIGLAASIAVAGMSSAAHAQSDPYHITAAEKAACTSDAVRLCVSAYPDERKLLSCMSANRASLTETCLVAFDAGLKRRRIVSR